MNSVNKRDKDQELQKERLFEYVCGLGKRTATLGITFSLDKTTKHEAKQEQHGEVENCITKRKAKQRKTKRIKHEASKERSRAVLQIENNETDQDKNARTAI